MAKGDPRAQPPFRYGELTPDQFEVLVFRLMWADDHRVVRLEAPDGGLDTLLPDPSRLEKAERGWQAKRHTGAPDWDDCEKSLDRAVDIWDPRKVTFVLPIDLTAAQHATFARRLTARRANVDVDYIGRAAIDAKLATPEGRRIAAAFFEEHDVVALAERMLRAGSPLREAEDFLSAEGALARGLAHASGDFDWIVHRGVPETPEPPQTPGALMRLSFGRDEMLIHADLVPRSSTPTPLPSLSLMLDDSEEGRRARKWLEDLASGGGRLDLDEGVQLSVRDVPAPFGELLGAPFSGTLSLRARAQPAAFFARLVADPSGDAQAIDVDLQPGEAASDWDALLEGRHGGLAVSLAFRWFVHEGFGHDSHFTIRPMTLRQRSRHRRCAGSRPHTARTRSSLRTVEATVRLFGYR